MNVEPSVARVGMSIALQAYVAARIEHYTREAPGPLQEESPFAAEFGALPLYRDWGETIGIRPDGELVRWSTDGDFPGVRPVEDRKWMLIALVVGARRYAELAALIPVRPPEAVDCMCCSHPLFADGRVLCGKCCGLGWLT